MRFFSPYVLQNDITVFCHSGRSEEINDAIKREKEIKGWNRKKKEILINSTNPQWNFLNNDV